MIVVGICGEISTGKGVVSKILEEDYNFTPMGFIDPFKCICRDYLKIPSSSLWGPSEGRTPHVRRALQGLGKWGRKHDAEAWVNILRDRIDEWHEMRRDSYDILTSLAPYSKDRIVVTDLRLPIEAEMLVERYNAKLIKLTRDVISLPEDIASDETEEAVKTIPEDLFLRVIDNSGSIEDLEKAIHRLAKGLINATNS